MNYSINNNEVTIELSELIDLLEVKLYALSKYQEQDTKWSYTQQIENTQNLIKELKAQQSCS